MRRTYKDEAESQFSLSANTSKSTMPPPLITSTARSRATSMSESELKDMRYLYSSTSTPCKFEAEECLSQRNSSKRLRLESSTEFPQLTMNSKSKHARLQCVQNTSDRECQVEMPHKHDLKYLILLMALTITTIWCLAHFAAFEPTEKWLDCISLVMTTPLSFVRAHATNLLNIFEH